MPDWAWRLRCRADSWSASVCNFLPCSGVWLDHGRHAAGPPQALAPNPTVRHWSSALHGAPPMVVLICCTMAASASRSRSTSDRGELATTGCVVPEPGTADAQPASPSRAQMTRPMRNSCRRAECPYGAWKCMTRLLECNRICLANDHEKHVLLPWVGRLILLHRSPPACTGPQGGQHYQATPHPSRDPQTLTQPQYCEQRTKSRLTAGQ